MRRILVAIFVLMFLFSGSVVFASNDVKVIIDGQKQSYDNDQPPVIKNNRTLVPLRGIFESLGAEVKWYNDTQTVEAIKGSTTIVLQIGSYTAYVNGEQVILDQPAEIINGRTMVQIRFVSEALGAKVEWEGSTNSVIITSNEEDTDSYIDVWVGETLSIYTIDKIVSNDGYISIRGTIPSDEIKWIKFEIINNDSNQSQSIVYPVENNSISSKLFLPYGAGNYTIRIYESIIEEKYNSEYNSVDFFNVTSKYASNVNISLAETDNGIVNITGKVNQPNKWVWFLIKKNGTDLQKDVVIPVENNQYSKDLYLSMGAGEYTISVYENTEEYGYYRLNTRFTVNNLDTRDPNLLSSERIESGDPRIVALANQITEKYDTDAAKSRAIYDWVIKNIKYDASSYFKGEDVSHSALEVLELRTTDCDGYARLTAALHRAVGIEAKVVIGDTNGYGQPFDGIVDHAWNEVLIDGEWITVDTTWGAGYLDPIVGIFVSSISFKYYDPTNDFFAKTHRKLGELYE